MPLHRKKSTPGIAPEYIVAFFGVGTIYIFNITSIGSAVNPISQLCAPLITQWDFVRVCSLTALTWGCLVSLDCKGPVCLCPLTLHCAPHHLCSSNSRACVVLLSLSKGLGVLHLPGVTFRVPPVPPLKLSGCSHCVQLICSCVILHPSSLCEWGACGVAALGW